MNGITFHFAETTQDLMDVHEFVHDCLVLEEYLVPGPDKRFNPYPEFDNELFSVTLIAKKEGAIVGTTRFTKDSALGLPEDKDFKSCIDSIRNKGLKISSVGRTLTDKNFRSNTTIIKQFFKEVHNLIIHTGTETIISSVNPRYEPAYQRILNMQSINKCERMRDSRIQAGAVLMQVHKQDIPENYKSNGQSLICNFNSKKSFFTNTHCNGSY